MNTTGEPTDERASNDATRNRSEDAPMAQSLPKVRAISPAMDVPVFNIVIYLTKTESGVQARVANLPDLDFSGSSEPLVLKQAITEVKSRLGAWHRQGESIPWIDPLPERRDGEQERLIPVHL